MRPVTAAARLSTWIVATLFLLSPALAGEQGTHTALAPETVLVTDHVSEVQ